MTKILDLNTFELPTLELVFAGENRTTLHVMAPTEALVDEMKTWTKKDLGQLAEGGEAGVEKSYDLFARLLSCNTEGYKLTGAELKIKIKETPVCKQHGADPLWVFLQIAKAYAAFISEIENEKN